MEPESVHLFVLSHGLWGQPAHLERLQQHLAAKLQQRQDGATIEWLNCSSNAGRLTYDGVDTCGSRLVKDVLDRIQQLNQGSPEPDAQHNLGPRREQQQQQQRKRITKLSFIGYSLGGLIARYAAGKLYVLGLFDSVEPVNFITIATPHLGSFRAPTSFWANFFNAHVPVIASRTGLQLMLADADYHMPWLAAQQQRHDRIHQQHQQQQTGPDSHSLDAMQEQAASDAADTQQRAAAAGAAGSTAPPRGNDSTRPAAAGQQQGQGSPCSSSSAVAGGPVTASQLLVPPGCDASRPVPLLLLMALPSGPFHRALAAFATRICAANINHDASVPYCTAAIAMSNPFDDRPPVPISSVFPSVVRPAEPDENPAPLQYQGRARLFLFLPFLPLLPLLYVYLVSSGWLHHRSTRQRPLDTGWLEQHARELAEQVELLGVAAMAPFSRQGSRQRRLAAAELAAEGGGGGSGLESSLLPDNPQQQQQQQVVVVAMGAAAAGGNSGRGFCSLAAQAGLTPAAAEARLIAGDGGPEGDAAAAAAAAAGEAPGAAVSSYEAALSAVRRHFDSEGELCRLEALSRQQLDAASNSQQQQQQQQKERRHVGQVQAAAAVAGGAAAGVVSEHDGIVEAPLLLHQQQEWMVKQLFENMPPSRSSGAVVAQGRGGAGWQRVDVCARHFHAHAAIMVRDKRFESQSRDFFDFLAAAASL